MDTGEIKQLAEEVLRSTDENSCASFLEGLVWIHRVNTDHPQQAARACSAMIEDLFTTLSDIRRKLEKAILERLQEDDPFGVRNLQHPPTPSPTKRELLRSYLEELGRKPSQQEKEILTLMVSTQRTARVLLDYLHQEQEP